MAIEEACGWCGEWFEKRGNKRYCCKECSELAGRQMLRLREEKKRHKKNAMPVAGLSIDDVVDLALKLSAESGKTFQYDDIQTMLIAGDLKGGAVK